MTPGIRPSEAYFRKQILQRSNLRIYPLARPHTLQRRTSLVENFGFFKALRIIAFRAISYLPYFLNGMPIRARRLLASLSVDAVVQIAMFSPMIFSILSKSISGKMICSLSPNE